MPQPLSQTLLARLALSGLALVAVAALPACRGERSDKPPRQFLPDMDDSPKWKPQTATEFYADGRAMRQPVAKTVAFGPRADAADAERARFLRTDFAFATGLVKDSAVPEERIYVESTPAAALAAFMDPAAKPTDKDYAEKRLIAAKAMLDRGEERFKIYCTVCHGYWGKGDGMVGKQWGYSLDAFSFQNADYRVKSADPKAQKWKDGFLFYTIRNGVGEGDAKRMPAYSHALSEKDAWAVVAYIRAIQSAHNTDLADPVVPESERSALLQKRPAPTPAATTPPAPTPPAGAAK
jgi:mono/diheme cytochrome c family protein